MTSPALALMARCLSPPAIWPMVHHSEFLKAWLMDPADSGTSASSSSLVW